jgi:hypothetical protein
MVITSAAGPIVIDPNTTLQFQSGGAGVGDYGFTTGGVWTFSNPFTLSNATIKATSLPGSAGSGGLYMCIDSTGAIYKKSSCP